MRAALRVDASENAGPLIQAAIRLDRERRRGRGASWDARDRMLRGHARPWDAKAVRGDDLTAWRVASHRPRLDFDRDWALGPALLFPEYAEFKGVAKRLCAAALVGRDPEPDLAAAIRLAGLVAQEPKLLAQFVAIAMVRIVRRVAAQKGVAVSLDWRPSLLRAARPAFGFPRHRVVARYVGGPWKVVESRRMPPDFVARHAMRLLRLRRKLWLALRAAHDDAEREAVAYARYANGPDLYAQMHRLVGPFPVAGDRIAQAARAFVDFDRG